MDYIVLFCTFAHICSYEQIKMEHTKKNLIYKIAKSYYEAGLTQQKIASRFGISRIMVSRLLQKSLSEKIVEIKIYPPDDPNIETERALEDKYDLKECIIVEPSAEEPQHVLDEIGQAGVSYLQRSLQGRETIAVSWGKSLLSLVNALPEMNFQDIRIVQMIGGLGLPDDNLSGTELTRRMANKLNAQAKILSSPGIVRNESICRELLEEPQISTTLDVAKKADIALVGIGRLTDNSILSRPDGILTGADITFLKSRGAVGDISLRFFDSQGQCIQGRINKRVVGLTIDELISIPRVVGIAGGREKFLTVLAALKNKLINILITDKWLAKKLLKEKTK